MPTSFPTMIPHPYDKDDVLADAYRKGWNHGHGLACHNVPKIGEKIFSESLGHVTIDAENIREVHGDNCYQAEMHSRCYSPFEFTAKEFNDYGYHGDDKQERAKSDCVAEDLWEAFEAGANAAIDADLSEYTNEDYGIEEPAFDE